MPSESSKGEIVAEIVCWVVLAAASVATAWCAYQASLWNGEQTRRLAAASVAQFGSLQRATVANRNLNVDVGTFLAYVQAELHGDTKVTDFLRDHARPEFRPALKAWIADQRTGRPDPPNPFERPEYRLADQEAVSKLDAKAESDIAAAHQANDDSDSYMLHTVLFALSLFFTGARSPARKRFLQWALLVGGTLLFTLTVISLSHVPRAAGHPVPSVRGAPK